MLCSLRLLGKNRLVLSKVLQNLLLMSCACFRPLLVSAYKPQHGRGLGDASSLSKSRERERGCAEHYALS